MHEGRSRQTTSPLATPRRASWPATPSAARSHSAKVRDRRPPRPSGSTYASRSPLTCAAPRRTDTTVSWRSEGMRTGMAGGDGTRAGRKGRRPAAPMLRDVLVALGGGVGAARILSGLVHVVPADGITAIVNVGDDVVLHGLH